MIQYLKQDNKRLVIVGDIHGCFTKLLDALNSIGYNPAKDQLISVGDLIDRGPENLEVLDWFKTTGIPAVRGNHDDFMADSCYWGQNPSNWLANGGMWAVDEESFEFKKGLKPYAEWLDKLPYMIEIELDCGELAGVVHAECYETWEMTKVRVKANCSRTKQSLTWGRTKIREFLNEQPWTSQTLGVKWLFCGHSVVNAPTQVGNQFYLDTGACFDTLYKSDVRGAFSFAIIEPNSTEVKLVKCLT